MVIEPRIRRHTPLKAETALLEPFAGLPLSAIQVPTGKRQLAEALADLRGWKAIGFDTESKPTWSKDEVSHGPHVVQFATPERAYVFQVFRQECVPIIKSILEDESIVKVGFGLKSDRALIHKKLSVKIKLILDLNKIFRTDGYRGATGVRAAVAIVFNQQFHKAKKITTSNWSLPRLSDRQLIYAANDAYAAIRVLMALDRPLESLPIVGVGDTNEAQQRVRHTPSEAFLAANLTLPESAATGA